MTTQTAEANLSKNSFGNGAKISINVSNNSKKGDKEKSQEIALRFQESDDEKSITFAKWLNALHLDHVFDKLKELGVEDIEDMTLLDEEDFNSLNLKKIQMKKLNRAIAKLNIK